jgi:ParB-like chromosome segregation protein Spo0J
MMSDQEYEGLKKDIAENGQEEPIVAWQGKLIDGRNRLKACEELGIEPDWVELDEEADPVKYVISHNLHRRHLDESQRAMVGARLRKVFDDEAKERQKLSKGRGQKGVENLPHLNEGKSRDKAGEAVAVSGKSVDAATKVLTEGTPELAEMVDRGKVKVSKAATLVKKVASKEKQTEIVKKGPAAIKEATKPEPRRDPLAILKKQIAELDDAPAYELYRWQRSQMASAEAEGYLTDGGPELISDDIELLASVIESDNMLGIMWHLIRAVEPSKANLIYEFLQEMEDRE